MSSGKKQSVLFVVAASVFTAVMVAGIAGNVARGNYIAIPIVLAIVLLSGGAIWAAIWLNQRRIQIMFRQPTPDRLIEYYHSTLLRAKARGIPNADAAAAHLSALAATIYGQYDRAREELSVVDWDTAPSVYRSQRLDTLALIALLEKRDVGSALQLGREALTLREAGASGTPSILHDSIMVAGGEGDAGAIQRTQRGANRAVGAIPAVCAWALSLYVARNGQPDEAARYLRQAREAAPHFVGLT